MEVKIEDEDFVGAQVEDVMNTSACYPSRATIYNTRKGDIQIRRAPFYSVFGLVMPLDLIFILDEIGSFCYSFKWKNGEALDSLELLDARESGNKLMIKARNILKSKATYRLGLLDISKGKVTWGDKTIEVEDGKAFFEIEFKPNEVKEIDVILS